jgi:hypothetical protein
MKHETNFVVQHLAQRALPDAPLAVEIQTIERHIDWFRAFRRIPLLRPRRG